MTISSRVELDDVWVGEIPPPTDLTVQTGDGGVFDCTGAGGVTFKYAVDGGTVQTGSAAAITPASGVFRITWSAAAFTSPGTLRGVCWFTLGASRIVAGVVSCHIETPPVPIT